MKILQRYALRQFVPPFVLAILVLIFVLLMDRLFLLADMLVRKGVAVAVVSQVVVLSLPYVISICTPLGSLIGGVISYGRMAQDNEIRVIRAAGIRTARLFTPVALACLLLMVVMVGFNGYVLPESQHRVRNLLNDVARKRPAMRVREGVFMDDFPGYMIYIGSMDERRSTVKNVAIFETGKGKGTPGFVTAPQGNISYTADDAYMVMTLFDGEMHDLVDDGTYRRLSFQRHVINVAMDDDLVRRDREYRSDEEMLLSQLASTMKQGIGEVRDMQSKANEARTKATAGDQEKLKSEELNSRVKFKKMEIARHDVELQKRLSLAFSAFFFVFFGAPVGLLLRRGGVGTGFIFGLLFFAVFYILLLAGENGAESGKLSPFVGMWLPNIILVLPVTELFLRAFYERSILRFLGITRLRIRWPWLRRQPA
ncbi:MAG TPA: LptF/LptG family permease [bacterium]|nr:LptF/LptG family permease [bacterium]